jgi:hypothetical protein
MTLPSGTYFLSLPSGWTATSGRWQAIPAWYWAASSAPTGMIPMAASPWFASANGDKLACQFQGNTAAWGLNQPIAAAVGHFVTIDGTLELTS